MPTSRTIQGPCSSPRRLVANIAKQPVGNVPSMPLLADKAASRWRLAHRVSAVADRRYPGQSGEMLHPGPYQVEVVVDVLDLVSLLRARRTCQG
jgi:hypothetical protein